MHHREGRGGELGQGPHRGRGLRREARGPEDVFGERRALDDVVARERGTVADLGEEVTAEQRAGGLLVEHARVPAVGHVRCVDVTNPVRSQLDDLTVGERHRWTVAEVVVRDHAPERAVRDLGVRRDREELVHRAALVGLEVTERDPPQAVRPE